MTSRRVIVKDVLGMVIAVVLTVGMITGVALALQSGFQPVFDAERETSIRQQRGAAAAVAAAAAARAAQEQQMASVRSKGTGAPARPQQRELLGPSR
jgi:hypothetical protein